MERMDAVYDFDLSLHRSVQSVMDLPIHTFSSRGLLVHVGLWPHSVFLHEGRLFVSSLCICPRPAEFAELPFTIRYEDRLLVLLFCSIGHILVHCDLLYHAVGIVEKRFSHLSPKQDCSLCGGDYSIDEGAGDARVGVLRLNDFGPNRVECSRVAVQSLS